ncbi:hypothetical protein A2U01_0103401, partial [Trifolium medium]|nr:hypothetical protein [Trifolium medium]
MGGVVEEEGEEDEEVEEDPTFETGQIVHKSSSTLFSSGLLTTEDPLVDLMSIMQCLHMPLK